MGAARLYDLAARREQREWDETRAALAVALKNIRPLFVIAGNQREAETWAQRCYLAPAAWRYVSSVQRLASRRRVTYVLVGSYYRRSDWPELRERLREIDARLV